MLYWFFVLACITYNTLCHATDVTSSLHTLSRSLEQVYSNVTALRTALETLKTTTYKLSMGCHDHKELK